MLEPTKLCVIIVSDSDADRLMRRLVELGLHATKVSSTGGFLRHGSVTILSGVTDEQVDEVMALVHRECHARKEIVPLQSLPFASEMPYTEPIEVRVGGAIVFVLDVTRFERA
jgi:uncharacterized protein YaaQ